MRRNVPRMMGWTAGASLVGAPALADQPEPWGLWSQPPASPIMHSIVALNAEVTAIVVAVVLLVFALLGFVVVRFRAARNPEPARFSHNTRLEVAWTLIPVLILAVIAIPSFRLLYAMDRTPDAGLTVKVVGHQWYWTYDYPDEGVSFDSNLVQDADLQPGQPRLLATDSPLVVPAGVVVRVLVTADDVIHSWSVPSLGVKTDAIPGRLNETWMMVSHPGHYYGQCSQLCGINHAYMPIEVEAVPPERFAHWLAERKKSAVRDTRLADAVPAPQGSPRP